MPRCAVQSFRRSERRQREPTWVADGSVGARRWRVGLGAPEPAGVFVVIDVDGGERPSTTSQALFRDVPDDRRGAIVLDADGLIVGVAALDVTTVWIETARGTMIEARRIEVPDHTTSTLFAAEFSPTDHPTARHERAPDGTVRRIPYPTGKPDG
jgi:hypothetical protein